jgi:hypothetical protein
MQAWPSSPGSHVAITIRQTAAVLPERIVRLVEGTIGMRQLRALRDADLRVGIAIATALGEAATEAELGDDLPWLVDLALDPAQLAMSIGAMRMESAAAIALLLSAQVMLYSPNVSGAVRLTEECWAPLPEVRAIHWGKVREQLAERQLPRMPATALLRELVLGSPDADGWVALTLEHAAARTFFKRSALARAAADLERIGCVERSHRPGQRGVYRVTVGATSVTPATSSAVSPAAVSVPIRGLPASVPLLAGDAMASIEISGVRFPIPAGVALTPEIDADGRMWYRLGAGPGRIGPLT